MLPSKTALTFDEVSAFTAAISKALVARAALESNPAEWLKQAGAELHSIITSECSDGDLRRSLAAFCQRHELMDIDASLTPDGQHVKITKKSGPVPDSQVN